MAGRSIHPLATVMLFEILSDPEVANQATKRLVLTQDDFLAHATRCGSAAGLAPEALETITASNCRKAAQDLGYVMKNSPLREGEEEVSSGSDLGPAIQELRSSAVVSRAAIEELSRHIEAIEKRVARLDLKRALQESRNNRNVTQLAACSPLRTKEDR